MNSFDVNWLPSGPRPSGSAGWGAVDGVLGEREIDRRQGPSPRSAGSGPPAKHPNPSPPPLRVAWGPAMGRGRGVGHPRRAEVDLSACQPPPLGAGGLFFLTPGHSFDLPSFKMRPPVDLSEQPSDSRHPDNGTDSPWGGSKQGSETNDRCDGEGNPGGSASRSPIDRKHFSSPWASCPSVTMMEGPLTNLIPQQPSGICRGFARHSSRTPSSGSREGKPRSRGSTSRARRR